MRAFPIRSQIAIQELTNQSGPSSRPHAMARLATGALLLAATAGCSRAVRQSAPAYQPIEYDSSRTSAGSIYYGDYVPAEVLTFAGLPEDVRNAVDDYLTSRLGERLARAFVFRKARIVDFDELAAARQDYTEGEWEWQAPKYNIFYKYEDPAKGIRSYVISVALDADLNVINHVHAIQFPDYGAKGITPEFISLDRAREVANEAGLPRSAEPWYAAFEYDKKRDAMIWRVSSMVKEQGTERHFRCMDIDALSGAVLRQYADVDESSW
jgi:hypothetical protein